MKINYFPALQKYSKAAQEEARWKEVRKDQEEAEKVEVEEEAEEERAEEAEEEEDKEGQIQVLRLLLAHLSIAVRA